MQKESEYCMALSVIFGNNVNWEVYSGIFLIICPPVGLIADVRIPFISTVCEDR